MWRNSRSRLRRARPEPLGSMFSFPARADHARRQDRLRALGHGLSRVRRDIDSCRRQEFLPGKRTRVRAGQLAYVDLLVEACALLDVEHDLEVLRGIDRQLEVLRVEAALGSAGLDLEPAT